MSFGFFTRANIPRDDKVELSSLLTDEVGSLIYVGSGSQVAIDITRSPTYRVLDRISSWKLPSHLCCSSNSRRTYKIQRSSLTLPEYIGCIPVCNDISGLLFLAVLRAFLRRHGLCTSSPSPPIRKDLELPGALLQFHIGMDFKIFFSFS
jgi:hypothetical protein